MGLTLSWENESLQNLITSKECLAFWSRIEEVSIE